MKKLLHLLVFLFLSVQLYGQVPQAFSYQAVARDNAGVLLQNQTISVQILIRDIGPSGPILYVETHALATNDLGLFSLQIGTGFVTYGVFSNIIWDGNKYLDVYMDPTGSNAYIYFGNFQLLSVPFAFHAESSTTVTGFAGGDISGSYSNLQLNPSTVGTVELANNSVTGSKLSMGGDVLGDMLIYNGTDYVRLPPGSNGQVLKMVGGVPTWQNMTGVISNQQFLSGGCTAPTSVIGWISTKPTITITSNTQKVVVMASCALGAGATAANALNLYIGVQSLVSGSSITQVGGGTFGLTCPANQRLHYSLSGTITGLSPGTWYVGMVGSSASPANWNNNEWSYVTVLVID